jgi:hypothetical protein
MKVLRGEVLGFARVPNVSTDEPRQWCDGAFLAEHAPVRRYLHPFRPITIAAVRPAFEMNRAVVNDDRFVEWRHDSAPEHGDQHRTETNTKRY